MKLYKFYKPTCSPCKTLKKIMDMIVLPEDVELIEVNASDPEMLHLLKEHDVEVVPVLLFENSNRMVGVKSKAKLEPWLLSYGEINGD